MIATTRDQLDLESSVKEMYRLVAQEPDGQFHFEMGRQLAEGLGYAPVDLDEIPAAAVDSFVGVGYHFDLAGIQHGENVLDLGSGSGMDTFIAGLRVGASGLVAGIDMTPEQREKAESLRNEAGYWRIHYEEGYLDELPFENAAFDVVISNGVINLCSDKERVFREGARVLISGGRLAISDVVSEIQPPESIICNASLWAARIGGAMQQDEYRATIERAGLKVKQFYENPEYRFLSNSAAEVALRYGVKSVSLLAVKE